MKRWIAASLLFFVGTMVRAQTLTPWPPDASTIFAPGVEVLKVEMVELPHSDPSILPDQRLIQFADGRTYPWSEDFSYVAFYTDPALIIGDKILLRVMDKEQTGQAVWALDLTTGEYQPYDAPTVETPCGTVSLEAMSYTNGWRFYPLDNLTPYTAICDLSTGRKSPVLPEGHPWDMDSIGAIFDPVASPDGKKVIILGQLEEYRHFTAFAYDVEAQTFQKLAGDFRLAVNSGARWVTDDILVINSYDAGTSVYNGRAAVLDLAHGDIHEIGPVAFEQTPALLENPFSILAFMEEGNYEKPTCHWEVYDILARTTRTYPLGTLCKAEYGERLGVGYYRDIADDRSQATLVRYNAATGERADLYTGEIEQIEWVSPDESLAALVLSENGRVNILHDQTRHTDSNDYPGELVLMELKTGKILYQSLALWQGFPGHWAQSFSPMTDDWFQIDDPYGSNTLLHLENGVVHETPVSGKLSYVDNDWALMTTGSFSQTMFLYNLSTGQTIDFIPALSPQMEIKPLTDNRLEVTISDVNGLRKVIYTVRVPDVEFSNQ